MIRLIRNLLVEPSVRGLDPDSPAFTAALRDVLQRKPLVRRLFEDFYWACRRLDAEHFGQAPGARLEIGSGASLFKHTFPDVLTSDIKALPFVDFVARGEHLPFRDESMRAIYAVNVFHHLPDPRAFLRESIRVLRSGGGLVLIDPYHGPFARFLFGRLTSSERFDMAAPTWETVAGSGPMSNANQALSYIVFTRDRHVFESEFPQLEIVLDSPHTHLRYILSGGLNFRQLVPDWCGGALTLAERALTPLTHVLALQHTVVVRKRFAAAS